MTDQESRANDPAKTELDPRVEPQSRRSSRTLDAQPGSEDKELYDRFPGLTPTDLDRITVIHQGTELEQGAVYVDLNRPGSGPFKAIGGDAAGPDTRLIAKKETDYETWNRIVREDRLVETDPAIDRPSREAHGITNQANLTD